MNLGYLNHAFRRTKLWQNGLTENSAVTLDTPLKELMGIESMQAEDYPYTYSCVEPGGYCSSNISGNHSACGSKSKVLRIVKELEGLAVGLVLEEFRNLD